MKVEICEDDAGVARAGAAFIASAARAAVADRGRFVVALSGGRTPWEMLRALTAEEIPWARVDVVQVDERVARAGDPARNLTHMEACFLHRGSRALASIHAMPVEEKDLAAAARSYAATLRNLAGDPPVLDLVHLGLGADGHTASLVPADPVLDIVDVDVARTGLYQGTRRLTLTFPIIDRARTILWLVTGREKAPMLARLLAGDRSIPAGRVRSDRAVVIADRAAAPRER